MADNLSHADLIAKIAMNSKLTAHEVEEALELLSVVIQDTLQRGGRVDLLGVGTFSATNQKVDFAVGQSLAQMVADPGVNVQIERQPGILSGRLFDVEGPIYKHKVNVC